MIVLGEEEAVQLKAVEEIVEKDGTKRPPGSIWMIEGPCDFIPSTKVQILEKKRVNPLEENDGIYIRNKTNGKVRLEKGPKAYMLTPEETLWYKVLNQDVLDRLESGFSSGVGGDRNAKPIGAG